MTIQTINLGTTPNDGSGDTIRTAGQKINANFDALDQTKVAADGDTMTGDLILDKTTSGDARVVEFSTGGSARARLGLIGDDNLTLKVSGDGSAWLTTFVVDRVKGNVGLGAAPGEAIDVFRTGSAVRIAVSGDGSVNNRVRRYSNNANSPSFVMGKARGTIALPASVAQADSIGSITWQAYRSGTFGSVGSLDLTMLATTPSSFDMENRLILTLCPPASGVESEILRIEHATGLSLFGTNPVIDQNRHHRLRSYTVATLPSASPAGQMIYVSDGTSNKRLALSDGTNFRFPDGNIVS